MIREGLQYNKIHILALIFLGKEYREENKKSTPPSHVTALFSRFHSAFCASLSLASSLWLSYDPFCHSSVPYFHFRR